MSQTTASVVCLFDFTDENDAGVHFPHFGFSYLSRDKSKLQYGPLDPTKMGMEFSKPSTFDPRGDSAWGCGHLEQNDGGTDLYPPFSFTITSGSGVGTNPINYTIHGSGHGVCVPAHGDSLFTAGTVTIDITF